MSTHIVETKVSNLKINKLTQAQYADAVQQGFIGNNELSIITDVVDGTVTVMPTPSAAYIDAIVQFAGVTDVDYTNGYFYKCVSNGEEPATYSWEQVDVQPSVDPLPSQTGNAGKFLKTDGTDASWGSVSSSTTGTVLANAWVANSQTITVLGVTSSNTVIVAPAPTSASDYSAAEILCTAQGTDSLTFTCTTVPANAIIVNVVILN